MDHLASTAWLEAHLTDANLRVIAVPVEHKRGAGAVIATGDWAAAHIPGSQVADLPGWLSGSGMPAAAPLSPDVFAAAMEELGVGMGTRVVVYDLGGNAWAARLWWMLHAVGFDDAAVLDGGWQKWQREGRAQSSDAESPRPARLTMREKRPVFVDNERVHAALEEPNTCVITTHDAAPLPTVGSSVGTAGHLLGSVNVPYLDTVDPTTGAFVPEAEIRRRFGPRLAFERIVTYCGGGVTAASEAFLLSSLGHPDVAAYDPSFVDWASESTLPIMIDTRTSVSQMSLTVEVQ